MSVEPQLPVIACALDPRFRGLKFLNNDQIIAVKEKTKSLAEIRVEPLPIENHPKRKKNSS